ncbi:MAG TPA: hypothetical protein VHW94_00840 [Candidatus Dormibacteraeota bacterium]|nr:hypothetical protein [Candidatus Dormibacteraeota bacterium]
MAHAERYGPGQQPSRFEPGDFILAHRHNPMGGLISWGEKRRFRGGEAKYAHWTHCATVVDEDGQLVEAESTGVKRSPIGRYKDDEYHLVRLGSEFAPERRAQTVAYAEAQVGQAFGYLELFAASLFLLFGWRLRLMRRDHQICSGLVVRALQKGGEVMNLDPDLALPADLAKIYDVVP